jgi:hypothetical protein
MSVAGYVLGLLRLAILMVPLLVACRRLRRTWLPVGPPSLAVLLDAVGALAGLIVGAEILGLFSLMRWWSLALLFVAVAVVCVALTRSRTRSSVAWSLPAPEVEAAHRRISLGLAATAVAVVLGQWTVLTADALGGGILSFDSLWYHLPFAAAFAQTGSVTHVVFTQADPFVAYYPANAELLNAIGLVALHNDFLAPLLNLGWLGLALLAGWCLGRRWRIEPVTLTAACAVLSVPVLSATQPGTAFNDVAGLAALLAAIALLVNAEGAAGILITAGLALGLALGTKLTFAVPAVVIVVGQVWITEAGRRVRDLTLLALPCLVAGGWWYLRAVLDTGSPLGLGLHIGPLRLVGPRSPMADSTSQTVLSALSKPALWGSRLAPGLHSALGLVWPVPLALTAAGIIAGLLLPRPPVLRVLAAAGLSAVLAYLVVPTGASAIEQQTQLFAVNLRYLAPALVIGVPLAVLALAEVRPSLLPGLCGLLLLFLLVTQLDPQLWRTQTARHGAFIVAVAVAAAAVWGLARLRRRSAATFAVSLAGVAVVAAVAGLVVERHYFSHRYLTAAASAGPLDAIYRWAQGVAHARVALYGTVEQYPLYGARDTNRLQYLGQAAPHGGFEPIRTCSTWRNTLHRGRFQYLVLTPGPTAAIPAAWTTGDPAAHLIMSPSPGYAVYGLDPDIAPQACPGAAVGA